MPPMATTTNCRPALRSENAAPAATPAAIL